MRLFALSLPQGWHTHAQATQLAAAVISARRVPRRAARTMSSGDDEGPGMLRYARSVHRPGRRRRVLDSPASPDACGDENRRPQVVVVQTHKPTALAATTVQGYAGRDGECLHGLWEQCQQNCLPCMQPHGQRPMIAHASCPCRCRAHPHGQAQGCHTCQHGEQPDCHTTVAAAACCSAGRAGHPCDPCHAARCWPRPV
jgi:hypothetical protein